MISVNYTEAVIEKAQKVVRIVNRLPRADRDEACKMICGLSYDYLKRLGKHFKSPSARVLMNLGFELYLKDLDTGEFSRLEMNVPCDWNPLNPRANPTSMPIFSGERLAEFSGRE